MPTDTRQRMLQATATLLLHRGYHGVSLRDVLQASDAPRGSLYHHFPGGKDQLVLEATRKAVEETTGALIHAMEGADSPGRGVRAFLEEAARLMEEREFAFGCPVAPVILDAAGEVEALARLCGEAFDRWIGILRDAFVGAGISSARAETLALLVESALEGLLIIARARRDARPFYPVAAELANTIDAAVPGGAAASGRSLERPAGSG